MIANLDDAKLRSKIVNSINSKRGMWRIAVTRYRPRRSDRQNRYYWPCFVQPLGEFLRDQGEPYTDNQAHAILKQMFLRQTVEINGERVDITRSTADLDTAEFNAYLDQCAAWLADSLGIIVPDPQDYYEPEGLDGPSH